MTYFIPCGTYLKHATSACLSPPNFVHSFHRGISLPASLLKRPRVSIPDIPHTPGRGHNSIDRQPVTLPASKRRLHTARLAPNPIEKTHITPYLHAASSLHASKGSRRKHACHHKLASRRMPSNWHTTPEAKLLQFSLLTLLDTINQYQVSSRAPLLSLFL